MRSLAKDKNVKLNEDLEGLNYVDLMDNYNRVVQEEEIKEKTQLPKLRQKKGLMNSIAPRISLQDRQDEWVLKLEKMKTLEKAMADIRQNDDRKS